MKHKWFVYTRGTIHLHRASTLLVGMSLCGSRYNGSSFKSTLYINLGPKLWWAWDEDEMISVGKRILDRTKTEKGKKEHFRLMRAVFDKAIKSSDHVRKKDLSKLSDKELDELYKEHDKECYEAFGFLNIDIDAIDIYPAEFLKELIRKEIDGNEDYFTRTYNALTSPAHKTYVQDQEESILDIVKRLKSDKDLLNKFNQGDYSLIKKELDELVDRFWWTSMGWENLNPNSKKFFIEAITKHVNDSGNISKALDEIKNSVDSIKKQRQGIVKKHNISKEIQYLLGLFDEYAYWHDRRKEMQVKTIYSAYLILLEVAKRKHCNPDDIEWLWHEEVSGLLKGKKPDKEEIERRKKAVAVLVEGRKIRTWSGEKASRIKEKEFPEKQHDVNEIKGVPASPGKAKGIARVCAGAEEAMKKVKRGDILVCGMTLPDYVPAMKRAAAIVTDEGGITCHAAIISRELKIPCVVGTKIATQAIKDGDMIEVDANKGIITKVGK